MSGMDRKETKMADFDNRILHGVPAGGTLAMDAGLRAYMLRVYNYMLVGLGLTGAVAWVTANTAIQQVFFTQQMVNGHFVVGLTILGMIAIFAPIGLVLWLSMGINKLSVGAARAMFWVYAASVGISVATILLMYTGDSVARVFFITAATFGAMSLWGYTTKRDLTGMGHFMMMGLIGILIAMVVNIFIASSMIQFVVSIIGVIVFTGLTAYDTQSIKESYSANDDGTISGKKAIIGALRLYLDFINLFFMLMRLLGNRR
jgi:FtsH-binding integral membrane protein